MKKLANIDWYLFIPYLIVSGIGLIMIYSASSYRLLSLDLNPLSLFYRQIVMIVIAWVAMGFFFLAKIKIVFHWRVIMVSIWVAVLLLLLTKTGIFGASVNGSQRWITLFGIQFQPAEFANISLLVYLSYGLTNNSKNKQSMKKMLFITALIAGLILIQPKVSGAIMVLLLASVLFIAAKVPYQVGIMLGVSAIILMALGSWLLFFLGDRDLLPRLFNHVYDRIKLFGDPFKDPYGSGYQMTQSYFALHNGGLWGLGLGNSITKKGYLPETETDFIFSIIVEELGLIFALFILAMLIFICLRLFVLSTRCKNQQEGLFLLGTGTLLLMQISVNVASISGLIPMTGVPLPFVSYGGTNYILLSLLIALALNISAHLPKRTKVKKNPPVASTISV